MIVWVQLCGQALSSSIANDLFRPVAAAFSLADRSGLAFILPPRRMLSLSIPPNTTLKNLR